VENTINTSILVLFTLTFECAHTFSLSLYSKTVKNSSCFLTAVGLLLKCSQMVDLLIKSYVSHVVFWFQQISAIVYTFLVSLQECLTIYANMMAFSWQKRVSFVKCMPHAIHISMIDDMAAVAHINQIWSQFSCKSWRWTITLVIEYSHFHNWTAYELYLAHKCFCLKEAFVNRHPQLMHDYM